MPNEVEATWFTPDYLAGHAAGRKAMKNDEMSQFGVYGEIIADNPIGTENQDRIRFVVFTVEAEDRDDAKFLFYHGVHLPEIPEGWSFNRMDMRTLYKVKK